MSLAAALPPNWAPTPAAGAAARLVAWLAALDALHAADVRAAAAVGAMDGAVDPADARDIEATLGGDGGAYARLVRRHQGAVARAMHRFTRDRSLHEQLVQDVFVEAWRSLSGFRGEAPFPFWLRRIATRVGYQHWRAAARERAQADRSGDGAPDDLAVVGDGSGPREAAELVHALLARLPPRDRLVLTLVHLEGCGTREVAARTGWSRTLVKVAAFRARKRLAALLRRRGDA